MGWLLFLGWCTKTPPTTTTTTTPATGEVVIEQKADERQTYQSKKDWFSIQFPGTRSFQEDIYGASVLFSSPTDENDKIRENLAIAKKPMNKAYTLEEYYTLTKGDLEKQSGYTEIENTTIKINDLDAKKVIFTSSINSTKLQFEELLLIKDNFVYIITYTATEATFDQYIQKVDEMIATLEIK